MFPAVRSPESRTPVGHQKNESKQSVAHRRGPADGRVVGVVAIRARTLLVIRARGSIRLQRRAGSISRRVVVLAAPGDAQLVGATVGAGAPNRQARARSTFE